MTLVKSYDYVVVGGGSSGCIVAARLAEENLGTVLLLEAGQSSAENPETMTADGFKYTFSNESTMWDRMTVAQAGTGNKPVYCGSGTGMGGSGSVNGMVYTRGDKLDYAQWPRSWQWDDIAPYFQSLEERLRIRYRDGTEFTEAAVNSATKLGLTRKNSLNDGNLNGFIGYNDMNFEGNERRSSYMSFVHGRETELDLLTVITKAKAQRIIFDSNQTAVALEFAEKGIKQRVTINREIILCAGALETPKLLMLSGIGAKEELERFSIPVVANITSIGKNLQDHPNVCIFYRTNKPIDFFFPQLYGFTRVNTKLELPANQADTCVTFFSVPSVIHETMKKMLPRMVLPGKLHEIRRLRYAIRGLVDFVFRFPPLTKFIANIYGIIVILGKPVSRGSLSLQSTNPDDQARIDLAYYSDPTDMQTMLSAIALAIKIPQQAELKTWGSKLLSKASASKNAGKVKKWIESASMTTYHYSGTCSMGEEPGAPVDLNLKLKGIRNVRVADASVMPVVPVSATNAPSMMIGYRAVEIIRSELSSA